MPAVSKLLALPLLAATGLSKSPSCAVERDVCLSLDAQGRAELTIGGASPFISEDGLKGAGEESVGFFAHDDATGDVLDLGVPRLRAGRYDLAPLADQFFVRAGGVDYGTLVEGTLVVTESSPGTPEVCDGIFRADVTLLARDPDTGAEVDVGGALEATRLVGTLALVDPD